MSSIQTSKSCKDELDNLKKEFYETNGKKSFFKNKQKIECAKMICSKYSLQELIANSIYQIGDSNKIFIDYTIFKYFINPDNYQTFILSLFTLFRKILETYKTYEVHINIDTFTVTAAERYKEVIKLYCEESAKNGTHFIDTLTFMKIYNLPSVAEMISKIMKPIINPIAYSKIVLLNKEDSKTGLEQLFTIQ